MRDFVFWFEVILQEIKQVLIIEMKKAQTTIIRKNQFQFSPPLSENSEDEVHCDFLSGYFSENQWKFTKIFQQKAKNRTRSPKDLSFIFENKVIKRATWAKYLGVQLDENLALSIHVENLTKKITSGLEI